MELSPERQAANVKIEHDTIFRRKGVAVSWAASYLLILLIPILGGFVSSSYTSHVIRQEIQNANQLILSNLQDQIDDHTDALAEKVEVYTGVFDPTGGTVTINLPFSPKAVLVVPNGGSLIPKLILPRTDHFAVGETGYCGDLNGNVLSLYRSLTTDAGYYHFYIAFA